VRDHDRLWAPPGEHQLAPAAAAPPASLLDFNGVLETAASLPDGIELRYTARARALAAFDRQPVRLSSMAPRQRSTSSANPAPPSSSASPRPPHRRRDVE